MTIIRAAAACLPPLLLLAAADVDAFSPQPNIILSSSSSVGAAPFSFRPRRPHAVKLSAVVDPSHHLADLLLLNNLPTLNVADAAADAASDLTASAVNAAAQTNLETVAVASDAATDAVASPAAVASSTYSKASYYTTLGLYILSFPGIWSQIKRSTEAKIKRKMYVSDGENATGGKDMRQQAGEIMAYMKANNYEVQEAGEVITFRGLVQKSASQAAFLVFCTALGMASLALVLQIQFQDLVLPLIGKPNWFYLVLLSPYAGIYYWRSGDRVDDVKVKLATNDDETMNEITIEGNDDELDRMWRALDLREKGMVKVEGLLEA